jgi:outer membrane protein assembly factor BamB
VLWTRDYQEVFGEKFSSDNGWSWHELTEKGDPGILIGQGANDERESTIVALDAKTGETLWSVDGSLGCTATHVSADQIADVLPVCQPRDFVVGGKAADGSVDALGVSVADGEVVWKTPLGKGGENYYGDSGDHALGFAGSSMVRTVTVDGKTRLLDLKTGELDAVPDGAVLLCSDGREVYERPDADPDRAMRKVLTGSSAIPCTDDRAATDAWAVSRAELEGNATDAGDGHVVVSGKHELVGFALD